jgi:alpha-glucosidase (family GH31 glycosyl hydrolase)
MRQIIFFAWCVTLASIAPLSHALEDTTIEGMDLLSWKKIAPGIWSAQIGDVEPTTFRDLAAAPPRLDALADLGEGEFPFAKKDTRAQVIGNRTSVRLPLGPDEQIFGLGMQFKKMNRRGQVYHLRTDHYGGILGRTHAPSPFYVTSKGYGVLFNTVKWISVYPGVGNRKDGVIPPIRDRTTDPAWEAVPTSDAVEASAMTTGMEILVFAGSMPLDAVRRYNLYFGGGPMLPRWGLGFWHRVPTAATAEEVTQEVDKFAKRDFPLDVIGLEPGWQSYAYPGSFDWSQDRFPDPKGFVQAMSARDLNVNLWENPYVSPQSSMYDAIKPYTGSHMVWLGEVPDYTLPEARKILADHHTKSHLDIGVSGYKIDEVDGIDNWLWPDHATFPSGTSAEEMRQTYGLLMQKTITEMFHARNTRTYGLVRGSNAGASGYPFAIYSDYYNHKGFVTALCNASLSGVLWTPEIRSANSDEEWVRRMQTVCFSPLAMLNAWSSGLKPWSRDEVAPEIRDAMKWRIRFLPYLYTAFARYHFEGIPPFRAMVLEPGYVPSSTEEQRALAVRRDVTDQYMMGDAVLVAPFFVGQKERTVVLPPGNWYDFYTGDYAGNGEIITVPANLKQIPLFVKEGGIIPLLKDDANNTAAWKNGVDLEIRHYGTTESASRLYDDDGTTFDFEKGARSWYEIAVSKTKRGKLQGDVSRTIGSYPQTFDEITWRFMTK